LGLELLLGFFWLLRSRQIIFKKTNHYQNQYETLRLELIEFAEALSP